MGDIYSIQTEAESWLVEVQELKAQVEKVQEELEETEPCGPDCVITGIEDGDCEEGRVIHTQKYGSITINKENCLKYHWEWHEKQKYCKVTY